MKHLPIILCFLILMGCHSDPISTTSSDNPEIKYDYLFTIKEENIKVYRFIDGSSPKYIAVRGSEVQAMFDTQVGKSHVPDQIKTIEKKDLTPK